MLSVYSENGYSVAREEEELPKLADRAIHKILKPHAILNERVEWMDVEN